MDNRLKLLLPLLLVAAGLHAQVTTDSKDYQIARQRWYLDTAYVTQITRVLNSSSTHRQTATAKAMWDAIAAVTFTLNRDTTLKGNGTSGNPLGLNQQGASTGQVLKWNGTRWAPAADDGANLSGGTGITITGTPPNITITNTGDLSSTNEVQNLGLTGQALSISLGGTGVTLPVVGVAAGTGIGVAGAAGVWTITNTGDTDPSNDLTTSTTFGGDVSGLYNALTVTHLRNTPVSATAPTTGQFLRYNGSAWLPAVLVSGDLPVILPSGITGFDEAAQDAALGIVSATGGITATYNDGAGTFVIGSSTLGGDLSGNLPNPTVARIRGVNVSTTTPTTGKVLKFDGTNWAPGDDNNSGSVTGSGAANQWAYWSGTGVLTSSNIVLNNSSHVDFGNANSVQLPTRNTMANTSRSLFTRSDMGDRPFYRLANGQYRPLVLGQDFVSNEYANWTSVKINSPELFDVLAPAGHWTKTDAGTTAAGGTLVRTYTASTLYCPSGQTYPAGQIFISCWADQYPQAISIRFQMNSGTWTSPSSVTMTSVSSLDQGGLNGAYFNLYKFDVGFIGNYLRTIELTFTNPTSTSLNVVGVHYFPNNLEGWISPFPVISTASQDINLSNRFLFYDATGATVGRLGNSSNYLLPASGGNNAVLGVGTSSPQSNTALTVVNTSTDNSSNFGIRARTIANLEVFTTRGDATVGIGRHDYPGGSRLWVQGPGTTTGTYGLIVTNSTGSSTTATLTANDAGQVGIGTNAQTANLDLVGTLRLRAFAVANNLLGLSDASGNVTSFSPATVVANGNGFIQNGNSFGTQARIGTNDAQGLAFETSNTIRQTISSTGGVTYTMPAAELLTLDYSATSAGTTNYGVVVRNQLGSSGQGQFLTTQNQSGSPVFYATNRTLSTIFYNTTGRLTQFKQVAAEFQINVDESVWAFRPDLSVSFPSLAGDPTTPANNTMWLTGGRYKYRTSGATKTLANVDDDLTGASTTLTGGTYTVSGITRTITANAQSASITITIGLGLDEGRDYYIVTRNNGTNTVTINADTASGVFVQQAGNASQTNSVAVTANSHFILRRTGSVINVK